MNDRVSRIIFKCKNCNSSWYYPVQKCIYCKIDTEKIEQKELKVIGITQVNVESKGHENVPYFVVLLQDEFGNTLVKKTMKKYNEGEKFEA